MKILYVNSGMNFEMRRTSVELMIIKELQKTGHTITIISTDINPYSGGTQSKRIYDNQQMSTETIDEPIDIDGIPVYVLHCSLPASLGSYCPNASSLAKKIIKNYDVVHIASWYHHPAIVFSKIAFEYKVPYVLSAYAALQPENRSHKKIQKWFFDHLYTKKMIHRASGFHSVGDLETDAYIGLGADSRKIYRIDPAIAPETFEIKERTNIFSRIGVDREHNQYLLYLGRIIERKRIDLIIRAFAKLLENKKNIILVIAGYGTKSYELKIKQLIRELRIEENVKFAGLVLGNEKLELLESAKLLVHTPSGDIHPLAVEEALTMGIPVVITNCDMPEVTEYEAGMIVEPDVSSISQTLIKMLEDENKLSIFSKNAKKLVNEKYLLKDQVKKYESMYLNAIKNNPQI